MNSERSKLSEEKMDMANSLKVKSVRNKSSLTINIDSSMGSGISSQNLSLYRSDYSMLDDVSRPRSTLNYYPIEEIFITNTLGKPKRLKNNIPYSSHIRLSNFTPEEEGYKAIASSDSVLHNKVLRLNKGFPDLFLQKSTVSNVSADIAKEVNSASKISGRFRAETISSVDLIPPQPTNDRDTKIFWMTIIFLIIFACFSRTIYSSQMYT